MNLREASHSPSSKPSHRASAASSATGTRNKGPNGALALSGNSDTYTGTSPFLVADMRVRYKRHAHWSGAIGVDNLTNRTYWNFHPYNQRTWLAEVRYDY